MESIGSNETPFWRENFGLHEAVPMRRVRDILDICFRSDTIPFLISHTSQGKTTTVRHWCEDNGYRLHIMNMSGLEGTDLTGIPFPASDGKSFQYLQDGSIPTGDDDEKVVLFFDEVNRCEAGAVHALFQVLNRLLGSSILGQNVKLCLAANPSGSSYAVTSNVTSDSALLRRVAVIPCYLSYDEFMIYARQQEWNDKVVEFLENNADYMQAGAEEMESGHIFVTSGGWNRVSAILNAYIEIGHEDFKRFEATDTQGLRTLLSGIISPRVTTKFLEFLFRPDENLSIRELLTDLPDHESRAYRLLTKMCEDGKWGTITEMLRPLAAHILQKRPPIEDVAPTIVELYLNLNHHAYTAFQSHMMQVARELNLSDHDDTAYYAQSLFSAALYDKRAMRRSKEMLDSTRHIFQK